MTTGGGGAWYRWKTPTPPSIWLNTAKAPSPSAASVADPANAAVGASSAITSPRPITAAATWFLIAVPPRSLVGRGGSCIHDCRAPPKRLLLGRDPSLREARSDGGKS